jgi:hypothetical protein
MTSRRLLALAFAGATMLAGTAQAGTERIPGYWLETTVCAPAPVSGVCVSVPGGPSGFRDAHCEAYVSGYNVGDPTTTITMYAYAYSSGSTYAEIYCEARHDGTSVFSVSDWKNGPSATVAKSGTISTDALPSSLYCTAVDDWIGWIC